MKKKGFTLIELLVVMVIIGIVTTVSLASIVKSQRRSRDTRRKADIASIQSTLESYYNQNKQYPLSGTESAGAPGSCGTASGWSCDYKATETNSIWISPMTNYADKLGKDPMGMGIASASQPGPIGGPIHTNAKSQHYYGYFSQNTNQLINSTPASNCPYKDLCTANYVGGSYYVLAAILENQSDPENVSKISTGQYYLNCIDIHSNVVTNPTTTIYNANAYIKIKGY